jgi:hypothetical protein
MNVTFDEYSRSLYNVSLLWPMVFFWFFGGVNLTSVRVQAKSQYTLIFPGGGYEPDF